MRLSAVIDSLNAADSTDGLCKNVAALMSKSAKFYVAQEYIVNKGCLTALTNAFDFLKAGINPLPYKSIMVHCNLPIDDGSGYVEMWVTAWWGLGGVNFYNVYKTQKGYHPSPCVIYIPVGDQDNSSVVPRSVGGETVKIADIVNDAAGFYPELIAAKIAMSVCGWLSATSGVSLEPRPVNAKYANRKRVKAGLLPAVYESSTILISTTEPVVFKSNTPTDGRPSPKGHWRRGHLRAVGGAGRLIPIREHLVNADASAAIPKPSYWVGERLAAFARDKPTANGNQAP